MKWLGCVLVLMLVGACVAEDSTRPTTTLFTSRLAADTGLDFSNELSPDAQQNIFNYMYFFNGAGVGTADFDGDGLYDLFFAGNQVEDRVYRNLGELRFEDVSQSSGIQQDSSWSTGVSVADVDADGKPDVYISVVAELSPKLVQHGKLYLNRSTPGNIRFRESGTETGLALLGYGSQVAWLDYDRDGDLDAYVLRHSVHKNGTFGDRSRSLHKTHPTAGDLFFRNDNGSFVDVTDSTGIYSSALGYGLGVTVEDFNADGWPDVYVANDFHEDDYLYLNNQRGGFSEVLGACAPHTSRFSMGVDAADLNGDNVPDLMVLDMLPTDKEILKASAGEDPYDVWQMKRRSGYGAQYSRNVLQLSKGLVGDSSALPLYEDVGILAGVHATDWSWSILMEDFSLDGLPDLFVTNGILGRSNNLDYIKFVTSEQNQARLKDDYVSEEDLALAEKMPIVKLRNRFFQSRSSSGTSFSPFEVGTSGFSHGAVSVDLDNDGDRDVVTSDVNGSAQLYENLASQGPTQASLLKLRFVGDANNPDAIGTHVWLSSRGERNARLTCRQSVRRVRGFLSSSDPRVVFANPNGDTELLVAWPDGTQERYPASSSSAGYQNIVKGQGLATERAAFASIGKVPFQTDAAKEVGIDFRHVENRFIEFNRQRLAPHTTSEEGPPLAVADVNGDGLDDVYIGGARDQQGVLYVQQTGGTFAQLDAPVLASDSTYEDTDALFIDFDADNDLDLFVLSGGSEFPDEDPNHQPRLYRNEGGGTFSNATGLIPDGVALVGSVAVPFHLGDSSDLHLALLPRTSAGAFGRSAQGRVLRFTPTGTIENATAAVAPWFAALDMITAAEVVRADSTYLVLARDFGPVTAHAITGSKISERGQVLAPGGLWSAIGIDQEEGGASGRILLGNLGFNSKLAARGDTIVRLYVADFDQNGSADQLVTTTAYGEETVFATRDEVTQQLVSLRKQFPDYVSFANASLNEVASAEALAAAINLEVQTTSSGWVSFSEAGFESFRALPLMAQKAPIRTFAPTLNQGVLAFGNTRGVNIQRGTYDAATGVQLAWSAENGYRITDRPDRNGLLVRGNARDAVGITVHDQPCVIVTQSDGEALLVKPSN